MRNLSLFNINWLLLSMLLCSCKTTHTPTTTAAHMDSLSLCVSRDFVFTADSIVFISQINTIPGDTVRANHGKAVIYRPAITKQDTVTVTQTARDTIYIPHDFTTENTENKPTFMHFLFLAILLLAGIALIYRK